MVLVAVDEKIVAVTTGCVLLCQDHLEQQENSSGSFSLYRRSRYRVMVENIPEGTSWQVRVLSRVYSLSLSLSLLLSLGSHAIRLSLSPFPPGSLLSFGFRMVLSLLESKSSSSLSLPFSRDPWLVLSLGSQGFDAQGW